MYSTWDLVQPRLWFPMSSLEQSMMELDQVNDSMARSNFPFRHGLLAAPSESDDAEFFRDLPVRSAHETLQSIEHQPQSDADADRAFSTYSFSSSTVLDDKGQPVVSTRRRYEDSTGRLKAMHDREVGGSKMRMTWTRQSKDDEGKHENTCTVGTPEDFDALWLRTPFGEAQHKSVVVRAKTAEDSDSHAKQQ